MRIRGSSVLALALGAGLLAPSVSASAEPPAATAPPPAATASAPAATSAPTATTAPTSTASSAPSAGPAPTASASAGPATTSAPAASVPDKKASPQGAIVVAISEDATAAARALARETYGDAGLRPRIDDATARVLAGEAAPAAAATKLVELADVRAAVRGSTNDTVTRRLLGSLGSDLGAVLVIAVTVRDGRPTARVLSVARGAFEPVELTGMVEPQPDGASRVTWPGVTVILGAILSKQPGVSAAGATTGPAAGSAAPVGPIAPKKDAPATSSFWSSPWTWVGIGAVVVAGVVVFAASQNQGDPAALRLQGRVAP